MILATLRTNAFVPGGPEALAFKLDSAAVPGLPRPVPYREIWVFSRRASRASTCAMGRSRAAGCAGPTGATISAPRCWVSSRRRRSRTPSSCRPAPRAASIPSSCPIRPPSSGRDAWLTEGTEAYKVFVRALLSLTDNLAVDGSNIPPAGVVCHDAPDPYLVVAADKGTATFSDTANAIALDAWLLARRRLRQRRPRRLRPQGDGDHRARRVDLGRAPFPRDGRRRPDRSGHRRRGRRHERRRVRQRHAAVAGPSAWSRHSTTATSSSIPRPTRRPASPSVQRLFALPRSSWDDYDKGADLARRRRLPAQPEGDPRVMPAGPGRARHRRRQRCRRRS